jgi:sulfite reductase beta subunit-like hemoprotein
MPFDPAMTRNEHLKQAKDGLDVWADIAKFATAGFDSISDDDVTRLRWFGIYQQKPNEGHFMWRIKLPGGRLTPAQLREIGLLANQYARGFGDITTRQDIQLHWMCIADFPDAIGRIFNKVGLYTTFACGDTPRNTTSCPLNGLLAEQPVDVGDLPQIVSDMYRDAGKELSNLPRKFKTALAACPLHCHQPQIQDLAMFAVSRGINGSKEHGLGIVVGGGLSSEPIFAQSLRIFIPQEKIAQQVPAIFRHVAYLFRDSDELRYKRGHARLKFLMKEKGWEWFRDELERRLGYELEHDDSIVNPRGALHTDHMGVGRQNNGLYYVGAPVARGRWTGDQMIVAADLAERFGTVGQGQIRLSQKQNLLLVNIPKQNIDALSRELDAIGLPPKAPLWRQSLVSCTGSQFCNLAVVETKERAREILEYLEEEVQLDSPIMISVTGCPHSCAQYQIADIGLTGMPVVLPDKRKVDGFNILVGGCLGEDASFGREIARKIPAFILHKVIAQLVRNYMANRIEDTDGEIEPFRAFVARHDVEQLRRWCRIPEWEPEGTKRALATV